MQLKLITYQVFNKYGLMTTWSFIGQSASVFMQRIFIPFGILPLGRGEKYFFFFSQRLFERKGGRKGKEKKVLE